MPGKLKKLHRLNAVVLAFFIAAHLINHLVGVLGPATHIAMMEKLRILYRVPLIDAALLAFFSFQALLGLSLVIATRKRSVKDGWFWTQRLSGLVLFAFIVQHIGANLMVRLVYPDLDTNFYWAAVVVSQAPFAYYFVPYYFLGVWALFVHVGVLARNRQCLLGRPDAGRSQAIAISIAGAAVAAAIVSGLLGAFSQFSLPPAYQEYLASFYLR